jgi:hypothetical protein
LGVGEGGAVRAGHLEKRSISAQVLCGNCTETAFVCAVCISDGWTSSRRMKLARGLVIILLKKSNTFTCIIIRKIQSYKSTYNTDGYIIFSYLSWVPTQSP